MRLTDGLKGWLVDAGLCEAGASDDEFRRAASTAMTRQEGDDGYLSPEKFRELTADKDADRGNRLEQMLVQMAESQAALAEALGKATVAPATATVVRADGDGGCDGTCDSDGGDCDGDDDKAADQSGSKFAQVAAKGVATHFVGADAGSAGGGARVKCVSESWKTTKSEARYPALDSKGFRHPLANERVFEGGDQGKRYIDHPSEFELAKAGAWARYSLSRRGRDNDRLPPGLRYVPARDEALVKYAIDNDRWGGVLNSPVGCSESPGAVEVMNRHLTASEKALIDDATSAAWNWRRSSSTTRLS